ncbi:hypothetical protein BDW75DRAFT_214609 [Aspergillus navahoensis]
MPDRMNLCFRLLFFCRIVILVAANPMYTVRKMAQTTVSGMLLGRPPIPAVVEA